MAIPETPWVDAIMPYFIGGLVLVMTVFIVLLVLELRKGKR